MLQIKLTVPGEFTASQVDSPSRSGNKEEAMVRVRRIGVCGTDLHAFAGRQPFFTYPRVLGHELGVEVESVSPGDHGLKAGDRCAVEPYYHCGRCQPCKRGRTNCCESLQVLGVHIDGGMRERLAVPVAKLHKSATLTFDQLALVETLSIGRHAVRRSKLCGGTTVLVVGAGPIGLAVTQFAVAAGATVTVLDRNPIRAAFATRFGATGAESVGGKLFDFVFDATGSQAAMEASFERVGFGGTLVFVGLVRDRVSFDDPLFHRREMTVLASRNSAAAFPPIIADIEAGRLDTTPWITHRLALADVPAEFPHLPTDPTVIKAMIEA